MLAEVMGRYGRGRSEGRTPGCGILRIIFRSDEDGVSLDDGEGPEV